MFTVAHLSRAKTLLNKRKRCSIKRVKTIKRRINMKYTVWVGGTEVTDYLVDRDTADEILMDYLDKGYDEKDVWIDEVVTQIDRAKEDAR
jgi:hypothetical protein